MSNITKANYNFPSIPLSRPPQQRLDMFVKKSPKTAHKRVENHHTTAMHTLQQKNHERCSVHPPCQKQQPQNTESLRHNRIELFGLAHTKTEA